MVKPIARPGFTLLMTIMVLLDAGAVASLAAWGIFLHGQLPLGIEGVGSLLVPAIGVAFEGFLIFAFYYPKWGPGERWLSSFASNQREAARRLIREMLLVLGCLTGVTVGLWWVLGQRGVPSANGTAVYGLAYFVLLTLGSALFYLVRLQRMRAADAPP
ncbi:MAG: hypothetical protein ACYDDF_11430 [Thermoplasmatota archaeon]